MYCKNCGAEIKDPVAGVVPERNKPLSPWSYFGLQILFAIPVLGFIFLIIFSCSGANINRRNFARSYWCIWVIWTVAIALVLLLGGDILRYI